MSGWWPLGALEPGCGGFPWVAQVRQGTSVTLAGRTPGWDGRVQALADGQVGAVTRRQWAGVSGGDLGSRKPKLEGEGGVPVRPWPQRSRLALVSCPLPGCWDSSACSWYAPTSQTPAAKGTSLMSSCTQVPSTQVPNTQVPSTQCIQGEGFSGNGSLWQ